MLIGDSIAWRGTDELGRMRPAFHLDGMPSRRLTDLEPGLDAFRLDHGDPDGLIVELGTNSDTDFDKGDLDSILDSLPAETLVMLVLPYRQNPHAPPKIQPQSTRYAMSMRDISQGPSEHLHRRLARLRNGAPRGPRRRCAPDLIGRACVGVLDHARMANLSDLQVNPLHVEPGPTAGARPAGSDKLRYLPMPTRAQTFGNQGT